MSNQRTVIKKSLQDPNRPPSSSSIKSGQLSSEYQTMKQLPPEQNNQKKSSYNTNLASDKHFTTQELNKLHFKRPDSTNKQIVKEELKKSSGPIKANHKDYNQSQIVPTMETDLITQQKAVQLNHEQQEKLKNLNRRPFSVKSSRQGSRPGTAQSENIGNNEKENQTSQQNFQIYSDENLYEEISIPDVDYEERSQLLKRLASREKDKEELELEQIFESLKKQVTNQEDIESLASSSMKELKDEKKQINIYKPTLKKTGNSNNKQNEYESQISTNMGNNSNTNSNLKNIDNSLFYPQVNSIVPIPQGNDGQSRLDQIYKQIKELQKFKDEIMDDLEEFMDDVESQSLITIPEQFDEVAEIIVNEQRERGEQIVDAQEKGQKQEIYDESGRPFWMKFIKADYLDENNQETTIQESNNNTNSKTLQSKVNEILQKEERIRREFEKIRKLDAELAQKTKLQRELKNARLQKQQIEDDRQKMGQLIAIQKQNEESQQKKVTQRAQSKGKPPSSSQKQRTSKKQQQNNIQDEDGGDTFLTDIFQGNKQNKRTSAQNKEEDDDSDEYQDVVYDYEQSQALMEMADDFLQKPLLALPPIQEDSPSKKNIQNQSQISFRTNATGMTNKTNKDFTQLNKEQAKNFNPYKKPMICDQLDDSSKNRLDFLMKDIDDNIDNIIKEKEDFYSADINKSQISKINDSNNAYLYSQDDVDKIERINQQLCRIQPMLPASEETDYQGSVMKSRIGNRDYSYDQSKILSNDDHQSVRSMPMSAITKRSNFTMLTHQSYQTNFQKLPKERKLREMAEQRMIQNQLKEIDNNLRKINETDDLSYASQVQQQQLNQETATALILQKHYIDQDTLSRLVEECREEEERLSIMYEMNENHDETSQYQLRLPTAQSERPQMQLAKIEEKGKIYQEAESIFKNLEQVKTNYWKVLDSLPERQNAILKIEERFNKIQEVSKASENKFKEKEALKGRLQNYEDELRTMLEVLESKENELTKIRAKEEEMAQKFENQFQIYDPNEKRIDINDKEEEEKLAKIMNDIEEYKKYEVELEQQEKMEREHNNRVLEDVYKYQMGRDDNANELEQFTIQQLDLLKPIKEDEKEENKNN